MPNDIYFQYTTSPRVKVTAELTSLPKTQRNKFFKLAKQNKMSPGEYARYLITQAVKAA